ncbi:Flp pilus assembly complex ATPase component TadA [Patescibacteria group bacterium]|nr:Flp pilus assembly complex ATPase component TadA [Patescibacteria group bacterium]
MTLVQQLVKKGILEKQKATALEYEIKTSGQKEEEVILEKRIVSEDFLFGMKSEALKIPFKVISSQDVLLKVLETIPEESARYYQMIPLVKEADRLEIGMVYPEDLKAREALEFLARQSKFSYRIFLITLSNFNELLRKYRTLRKEVTRALEELETEIKKEEKVGKKKIKATELERVVEEAPISKVVAVILRHAVDGNASDIHIEPGREKLRVRFRLDGILHASIFLPLRILPAIVARIKILSNLKIDETRIPQDGRFSTKVGDRGIDFRVSTFPTTLGEKVAIRILDPGQRKADFKGMGITGINLKTIEKALKKPYGMILATGPTGSGKTTTLYAILSLFNKDEVNIMTLEDPVEYFIEGVNQSQVKPEIGYSFASGLRYTLRQDPDILMVGEIRDEETASLAIHAALTGHILLSTLHTSNTLGVIPRLIDMGIQPFLLPPTLGLAIAQRLVRKLCVHCKKKIEANKEVKKIILQEIKKFPPAVKTSIKLDKTFYIYEPVGCKRCNNVGYSGRIGVYEILEMTDQLGQLILTKPSEAQIAQEAERQGMLRMKQDGMLKVLEGVTSLEEVLRVAQEK